MNFPLYTIHYSISALPVYTTLHVPCPSITHLCNTAMCSGGCPNVFRAFRGIIPVEQSTSITWSAPSRAARCIALFWSTVRASASICGWRSIFLIASIFLKYTKTREKEIMRHFLPHTLSCSTTSSYGKLFSWAKASVSDVNLFSKKTCAYVVTPCFLPENEEKHVPSAEVIWTFLLRGEDLVQKTWPKSAKVTENERKTWQFRPSSPSRTKTNDYIWRQNRNSLVTSTRFHHFNINAKETCRGIKTRGNGVVFVLSDSHLHRWSTSSGCECNNINVHTRTLNTDTCHIVDLCKNISTFHTHTVLSEIERDLLFVSTTKLYLRKGFLCGKTDRLYNAPPETQKLCLSDPQKQKPCVNSRCSKNSWWGTECNERKEYTIVECFGDTNL